MDINTLVGYGAILCLLFTMICEGTQRYVAWYERKHRYAWISKMIDAAILNNAIRSLEETHRLMDIADAQLNLINDEWQKGLDMRQ
jgi:hypothetical protein